MVHIFSRGVGTRAEDARARRTIESNWGTIERIADQISQGGYSARRQAAPTEPQPDGTLIVDMGAPRPGAEPRPYVRVSPNKRVVVVDFETARQMHFLGEIRRVAGTWRFVLATAANGFFAPVAAEIADRLARLDGAEMGGGRDDAALAAEIGEALGYGEV